jgi:phosphoenolpyruvate-protein kinase (PTS system EI component)
MSPESILEVRAAIARRSYEECRAAAAEALRAPDAGSARAVALSLLQER